MAQNGYFFGGQTGQNVPSVGGKGGGKPAPVPGLSRQPFSQGMGIQPAYGMPNQFMSTGHYAGPVGQNVPSANAANMSALPSQPTQPMLPPASGPRGQPWRYQPLANQQQNDPMRQGLGWLMRNQLGRTGKEGWGYERPRGIAEQLMQGYGFQPRGMPVFPPRMAGFSKTDRGYGVGGKGGGRPAPAGGGLVQVPFDPSMAVQSGVYRGA